MLTPLVRGLYEAARQAELEQGLLAAARRAPWRDRERAEVALRAPHEVGELPWWVPDVEPDVWGHIRQAATAAARPWIRRAERVARCGQRVQVWRCEACEGETIRPLYCTARFCARCAADRRAGTKRVVWRAVERMRARPIHMVLTIPSTARLVDGVRRLSDSWGRLRRGRWWRALVRGGVVAWEITRTAAGWHPHLHVLVDSPWLPWGELVAEWQRVTGCTCRRPRERRIRDMRWIGRVCCHTPDLGDGERHVDRCPGCECRGGSAQPHGVHVDRRPIRRAVAELVKYVVKDVGGCKRTEGEEELTVEDWAELVRVMWHRRALAAFGALHGVEDEQDAEGEGCSCEWCGEQALVWDRIEEEGYAPRAPPARMSADGSPGSDSQDPPGGT